jgi:putative membrane protein
MNGAAPPRRLHPVIPLVTLIKQAPEMFVPFVGVVAVMRDEGMGMLLLAIGGLVALFLAFRILAWWRFTYTLLPDEMYIESGIVSRNRRSIPWDRVQDVEIERGPLARLLGLAKVKLETGAAGSDEASLSARAETAAPPVFTMTNLRILQAGLTNFSVVWLAIIFGAVQYFDNLVPGSIDTIEKWIGAHEDQILGFVRPATIVLALGAFLAVGTIAGVIQMFVRNFGFTLSLDGRTLRRVRGSWPWRGCIAGMTRRCRLCRLVLSCCSRGLFGRRLGRGSCSSRCLASC